MHINGNCLQLYLKDDVYKKEGQIKYYNETLKNPENQKTDVHIHSTQSANCLRIVASFAQRLSIGWEKDNINMEIKRGAVFPLLKQLRIGKNVKNAIFFQRSLFPKLNCLQIQGKAIQQGLMRTDQKIQSLQILALANFKIEDHDSLKKLFQNISKIKAPRRIAIVDCSFPKNCNLKNINTYFSDLGQLRLWNVQNCNQIFIDAPKLYLLQMNSPFQNVQFLNNFPNLSLLETLQINKQVLTLNQQILKKFLDIKYYN